MAKKKAASSKKVSAKAKSKVAKVGTKAKASVKVARSSSAPSVDRGHFDGLAIEKVAQHTQKSRSKSEVLKILAEATGVAKKDVERVLGRLSQLIDLDISQKGPGTFTLPGLIKIVKIRKAATKARKGINPFTKEETVFKAKPARNIVKVRALKALKEMVGS